MTRWIACAFALGILHIAVLPALALADVPVHLRVIKGSKKGPAKLDASLEPLKRQLSSLAYVRWELTSDDRRTMEKGKVETVKLPDGDEVMLAIAEEQVDKVTFEVTVASRKTQSKLTVERGQRIVHQVSGEKNGSAFFLTVIAWPDAAK
ncbi:MAG TPA: hypothetical protein VMU15_13660 [Anaeromyxobacter sp.]|nr:hypothetical protein [Anaeromyxobacter sp.]